ncbi:MAG: hypothetical protein KC492_39905, partial [Myxococcales bacterium]|nr:hypothetical protein [Myxococcales bacterium]
TDILDEWSGDDTDELFELLETQLGEVGIDLKTEPRQDEDDDDEEDEEEEDEDEDESEDDDEYFEDEDDEL